MNVCIHDKQRVKWEDRRDWSETDWMDRFGILNDDALLFRLPQGSTASSSTTAGQHKPLLPQSAASILRRAIDKPRNSTGCRALDDLLTPQKQVINGQAASVGLVPGTLLELTGAPGEGKTRTCISLAVQAAVKSQSSKPIVLIIDTQGSIPLTSLHQAVLAACNDDQNRCIIALQRILLWSCSDSGEFLTALYGLVNWVDQHNTIEMIIIDSLSAGLSAYAVPALAVENMKLLEQMRAKQSSTRKQSRASANFQPNYEHSIIRTLLSSLVKDTCLALTASQGVSVVVTTQSKTKLTDEFGENTHYKEAKHSFAVPQFNNFWHIPCTVQILLAAGPAGARTAAVTACPSTYVRGRHTIFMTVASGIADLPTS